MKRVMIAVLVLSIAAGCDKPGDHGKDPAAGAGSAAASSRPSAAPAALFAGTYRAAWGDTVFTESGGSVNATYPGGSLACTAKESTPEGTWKGGRPTGKAPPTRNADGTIEGTWGNGESVKDGGKWSFSPKK